MSNLLTSESPIISVTNLSKSFDDAGLQVDVLSDVNLTIHTSERIAIVGTSGSGKSTLLHLLGGLDTPTSGEVVLCGNLLSKTSDKMRGQLRNKHLGFIYQFHHLLPEFTALENVAMPLLVRSLPINQIKAQAKDILSHVGLANRAEHKPAELSGGERQRVAIARALITQPNVILADEPTGNLDRKTATQIYDLMMNLNEEFKTAIVMVTHDISLAEKMDTQYVIDDGVLRSA
jgi:lipoprotein-releasing system ATP-binding protein